MSWQTARAQAPLPMVKPALVSAMMPMDEIENALSLIEKPESLKAEDEKAQDKQAEAPAASPPVPAVKPAYKLPANMTDKTIRQYARIFAAQSEGKMDKADALIKSLNDDRLMGFVLYQRYLHPTAYTTNFEELESWLARYADHAGADRIYKLASLKTPKGYKGTLVKPDAADMPRGYLSLLSDHSSKGAAANAKRIETLHRAIKKDLARGAPSAALRQLEKQQKGMKAVDYDYLRGEVAKGYLQAGKIKTARDLARASVSRSGEKVPGAAWIGGLSSWRLGDYKAAATYFEKAASSPHASGWVSAGGAYWASRAHMRAGNIKAVNVWLERAAAHPRTFYGLLATRALGWDFDFNWKVPDYSRAHEALLKPESAFRRADMLVRAGQFSLAEAELRRIDVRENDALREALIAYATHHALPAFAMRLAETYEHPDGGLYDAALYPLSPWEPEGGYKIDRALMLALIRQESRFNPEAQSGAGATGLMQLMPATASFVSGHRLYRDKREGAYALKNPSVNMEIGQRYVEDLLEENTVEADLMSMLIAYNAGPGNLRKWQRDLADTLDDPLLFIESIPVGETRNYVERVMANYWIYRLRLKQPVRSLDSVAEGGRAEYAALDTQPRKKLVLASVAGLQ